jgi:hypothetical protein
MAVLDLAGNELDVKSTNSLVAKVEKNRERLSKERRNQRRERLTLFKEVCLAVFQIYFLYNIRSVVE